MTEEPPITLREKIEDLRGNFDGFPWDSGAGSSGYNKAISDVLALLDAESITAQDIAETNQPRVGWEI